MFLSILLQVYRGVRSGVQPVAIKVMSEVNDEEAAKFAEVYQDWAPVCVCWPQRDPAQYTV